MKVKKKNLIGYILVALLCFQYSLINTDLEINGIASTIYFILCLFIFASWIVFQKFSFREFSKIILFLLAGILTYITTHETVFLTLLIIGVLFSKLEYGKGLHLIFYEKLFITLLIVLLSFFGVLDIYRTQIFKGGIATNVIGYGLGFLHPNQLAYTIGSLFLIYLCIRKKKIYFPGFIVLCGLLYCSYLVTKSRSLIIIVMLAILFRLLVDGKKSEKKFPKFLNVIGVLAMPVAATISLVLPMFMNTATGRGRVILYAINGLIGSRFTHISRIYDLYPLTPFGGVIIFDKLQELFNYSIVDNGYVTILFEFGVIGLVLFLTLYFIATRSLIKNKQYYYVIAIICLSLWGINENILRSFSIDFAVMFWAEILRNSKKGRVNK